MAETVFILMGSNLGDREAYLIDALIRLEEIDGLEIAATSGIYVSEATGMDEGSPSFMNQVVMADFLYLPHELLNALESIEKSMGRTGKGEMIPRTIDLDILLFGNQIVKSDTLSIPHPELLNRPFAMVPLLQIEPEIVHPATKRPVANSLDATEAEKIVLYRDHVARNV